MRTNVVNDALTIFSNGAVAPVPSLWHGAAMVRPNARAGGCFLTLFILGGFLAGVALRNPMAGVLIGTAAGAALAVLVWLADRRKG